MSSLLLALGRACYRRWVLVLAIWLGLLVAAGGTAVWLSRGTSSSFSIPGTESQRALDRLSQTFPEVSGADGRVVAVAHGSQHVTDADVRSRIEALIPRLRKVSQVDFVLSPWDKLVNGAISADRRAAIIQVQMTVPLGGITPTTQEELRHVTASASTEAVTFFAGGGAFGPEPVGVKPTEIFGVMVALGVLALTFGSLLAAGMPLVSALVGVGVTMSGVLAASRWITVSPTAPLLAVMIGLAVGIDYALFILSRHRAQLAAGIDPAESTGRAIATAGSAVTFAGLTVVIALAGLFVAQIPFLTVMGLSAAAGVMVAVAVALTLLPALFGMLGHRLTPRSAARRRSHRPKPPGRWAARWVAAVTRVPLLTVAAVITVLGVLAVPALGLRLALPDNGTAQAGSSQRVTYDLISKHFGPGYNGPLVVTADIVTNNDPLRLIKDVAGELRRLPGVASVPLATPNRGADTMIIQVVPKTGPSSASTEKLVAALRGLRQEIHDKYRIDIAVTGQTAAAIDISTRLGRALLPFGILVVGLSLILLAMVFRSIAVPIKAALGYLLSVAAAFGVTTAVYQWGWLKGPLHTVAVGPIISFVPIVLMGVLFGLAMDYEVFLVSRMREDYVHEGAAGRAVRTGYIASARVVTAAAVIMCVVFAAFVPEGDASLQPIALSLAVGVFIDAFVVRMTLVPAVMALLGKRAWWFPAWLDRLLPHFDVEGAGVYRQLGLADWPYPGATGVHATDLALVDRNHVLYQDVTFAVRPGELLLVSGGTAASRSALVLTLAGRVRSTGGRLKAIGRVLPEEAVFLRGRVALVRVADEPDIAAALDRELRADSELLVVDGLELVASAAARQALLLDIHRRCAGGGMVGIVSITTEAARELAVPLGVRRLDLTECRLAALVDEPMLPALEEIR